MNARNGNETLDDDEDNEVLVVSYQARRASAASVAPSAASALRPRGGLQCLH